MKYCPLIRELYRETNAHRFSVRITKEPYIPAAETASFNNPGNDRSPQLDPILSPLE